jgi:hypothetical protein
MAIVYSAEQREEMIKQMKGKTIVDVYYEDADQRSGPYWVMSFDDGSETSFRFMAELVQPTAAAPPRSFE